MRCTVFGLESGPNTGESDTIIVEFIQIVMTRFLRPEGDTIVGTNIIFECVLKYNK